MNKIFKVGVLVFIGLWVPFFLIAQQKKPNILLIITDQQNAQMMSCADNPWLKTPNIDNLAKKGIRFTKAYVTNPVCSPSRFSIFTGRYPSEIGMRHNGSELQMDSFEQIIPSAMGFTFKKNGYETYYGGKLHLPASNNDPKIYGFDELITSDEREDLANKSKAFLLQRKSDKPFLTVVSFINPHDICFQAIRDFPPQNRKPAQIPTPLLEAIAIPDSLTEHEFFNTYCPPLPDNFEPTHHEPEAILELKELHSFTIDAREHWTEKEWRLHRWAYHRLTENVDQQIGQVLDALQKSDFNENTIVIFTSDHGEMSASHRLEHKTVFYEESANVPLIVWYKGISNGDGVDDMHLISNGLDLYPTLCELSGIEVPDNLPGISFGPLLQNEAQAYKNRKYLYMENEIGFMIRDERYKYALYDNGEEMLIDTKQDPGEMYNVAGNEAYHQQVTTLKKLLLKHTSSHKIH